MAVNTSSPPAPVRSAMASALATSVVPAWTMFLRSLSSEAAASLITALTRAASDTGSFGPESNQTDASLVPPRSLERSRMIADDPSPAPIAALASVLAISIAACSTAWPGRSAEEVPVKNSAKSRATVIAQSSLCGCQFDYLDHWCRGWPRRSIESEHELGHARIDSPTCTGSLAAPHLFERSRCSTAGVVLRSRKGMR